MRALLLTTVVMIVLGFAVFGQEETEVSTVTGVVSSAQHETEAGYFNVGDGLTIIAKPGTDLHWFLIRNKGLKVRVMVSDTKVAVGLAK